MNYELKHFDTTLLRFSATEDSNTPEIKILSLDENKNTYYHLKEPQIQDESPILSIMQPRLQRLCTICLYWMRLFVIQTGISAILDFI